MEFGILGPVTACEAGRELPLGGARNQTVLAGLLLGAGSVAELVALAWDEPPATARQQLRSVVHRLRQVVAPAVALRTVPTGYQLDLAGHRLDAEQFTAAVTLARQHLASGELAEGVEVFREALGLWRGPALAGLDSVAIRTHAAGLDALRLTAITESADAELRLGRHRRLVPELRRLAAEHPLQEPLAALLMTALVRDGRRPDAIEVYHELAARLRDELGIDPGPALRAAYLEAISDAAPPPVASPRYLPRMPLRLVGRQRELKRALELVRDPHPASVVVIDGMAGIGKTTLAVSAAEALTTQYPGPHLYIDLHGHSDQQPVTWHEALHTLLRQLQIAPGDIPDGGPERAALWRQQLRGRRAVILLDNAASGAQIEPLLPPDDGNLILVTSRVQISSIDGAPAVSLDLLDPADAINLLRHTADQRVDDDAEAAAAITEMCGRLPLAIRLAGQRLRQRPGWTTAMLQEQLRAARWAPLTISVEGRSTAAAFDLSYRILPPEQQQLFRRLGLHPAGTVEAWAAAALGDVPVQSAVELLDGLVEANLVQADTPGRYRLHDLIHSYAEALVTDDERGPATVRMLDGYLDALQATSGHLGPDTEAPPAPREAAGHAFQPAADDAAWALTNWSTIVALINTAEKAGAHQHTAVLARLAAAHPLHEPLHARLITALARAGLQADALSAYATIRRRLADELGIDPGPELAEAHRRVLRQEVPAAGVDPAVDHAVPAQLPGGTIGVVGRQAAPANPSREQITVHAMDALIAASRDPDALRLNERLRREPHDELGLGPTTAVHQLHLDVLNRGDPTKPTTTTAPTDTAGPAAAPARGWTVPAQLPADVAGFVGRTNCLNRLTTLLDSGDGPATVVISAIAGTAGVGKTALAIHWAHQGLDRFPDGQLYVNLRGYDPDQPATAQEVLARFLTTLGVPAPDIPADLDEREARYRTELASRRMLIVLDNAATVDQVRPLLPGAGSSMVLVTSRDSLAGLVAVHGAHRLDLDLLPPEDAVTLLRWLIGSRVDADPDAAAALAALCAYLPLALRVAAELTVARDTTPLSEVVAELTDQQQRLDLLDAGGDPRAAVTAVFSWSMRHLPDAVVRTFRLLGLHPGPDIDAYAVAALTDTEVPQARRALDRLARAHLVHRTGAGRYGMHDLLRAYAGSVTAEEDSDTDRWAASTRLFDYYLACAASAAWRLQPTDDGSDRSRIPVPASPTPDFGDQEAARRWLDTERSCLVAAAAHTATHGWPSHTVRLSRILYRYLLDCAYYVDALAIHQHARDAARQSGDPAGQAHALLGLSSVNYRLDRLEAATGDLILALALWREAGDAIGAARALNNLGTVLERQGRYQAAAERLAQALALYREIGDQEGEARTLSNLAVVDERAGEYQSAADRLEQALTVYRQIGNGFGQGAVLNNLGYIAQRQGRYRAAADHYEEALRLYKQLGYPSPEAWALDGLGIVHTRLDQPDQAIALHQQALAIFKQSGERAGEARALNGLGEAALAAGRPSDALAQHNAALTTSPVPDQLARAHTGIGHAYHTLGDPARAREHYERALILNTDLGSPDADDIRARLAALDIQADSDHPRRG